VRISWYAPSVREERLSDISPVGEPRKRPHCLMCLGYGETKTFKITNALFRDAGLEPTSYSVTDTYRWEWHHVKAKSYH
jgi:hypothetical protein